MFANPQKNPLGMKQTKVFNVRSCGGRQGGREEVIFCYGSG